MLILLTATLLCSATNTGVALPEKNLQSSNQELPPASSAPPGTLGSILQSSQLSSPAAQLSPAIPLLGTASPMLWPNPCELTALGQVGAGDPPSGSKDAAKSWQRTRAILGRGAAICQDGRRRSLHVSKAPKSSQQLSSACPEADLQAALPSSSSKGCSAPPP